MKARSNKVLLLTGPGGSGKTTIAELLRDKYGYTLIDGDQLDTEFFPNGGQWDSKNASLLSMAHDKILNVAKHEFALNKNIVIDYIIFGKYREFIEKFKNEFGSNFQVKVLLPEEKENIERDRVRTCWTTGSDHIKLVRKEMTGIRQYIGADNFIDTSGQNPEESAKYIVQNHI